MYKMKTHFTFTCKFIFMISLSLGMGMESFSVHHVRATDTNVLAVQFSSLSEPSQWHTGDAQFCSNTKCAAIVSHLTKLEGEEDTKVFLLCGQLVPTLSSSLICQFLHTLFHAIQFHLICMHCTYLLSRAYSLLLLNFHRIFWLAVINVHVVVVQCWVTL